MLKNVDGVGGAFRGGAGCFYRGFRLDCRSGQCGLAVPLVVPELFFAASYMVGARRLGAV